VISAREGPVKVAIAIHNHQPVGNFDSVYAEAVERAYRPFLDALERRPGVRLSMHWSGPLLEWLERHESGLVDRIGALAARGQVELLSGAFYEPILAVIPPWDQQGQIERMNEYLERRFGQKPRGAWIAERVWEPELPEVLARAGIAYTLLDDHHFLLAGAAGEDLREPYWVESTLGRVGIFPIERELRYRIPFQPMPELLEFFRASTLGTEEVRVFGDDGEKFGIWPKTYDWVYGQGWLPAWLDALEERRVIEAIPLGEAWEGSPPRRTIALPTSSYPEMMLWALPAERQVEIEAEQRWLEAQGKPELARRLATGTWREFFARYPESRRLHRRVSELSGRIERERRSCLARDRFEEARREVHRAQCNCSYWHGVFGGFYLPHLRESVRESFLRADLLADELTGPRDGWWVEAGEADLRLKSKRVAVAVDLEAGGAIAEIADRRRPFDFAGVIARRREAYHAKVVEASHRGSHDDPGGKGKPETIHGEIQVKERGLEKLLQYDERPRYSSQEWLLADVGGSEGLRGSVSRSAPLPFAPVEPRRNPRIGLAAQGVRKEIVPGATEREFVVRFEGLPSAGWLASEWNLSLLTPEAPGRRLTIGRRAGQEVRAPGSSGSADEVLSLLLEDAEYLRVALALAFEPAVRLEWMPIETVSLSEAGAERVYQGTSFLAGVPLTPSLGACEIRVRIEEVAPVL